MKYYTFLLLSTLLFCLAGSIYADQPTDGNYFTISNSFTQQYIEAQADGSLTLVDNSTSYTPQAWLVQYNSVTDKYSFKNMETGLSLDVASDNAVRALATTNEDSQQFTLIFHEDYEYGLPYYIQHGDYYINGDGSIYMESIYSTGGFILMWVFKQVSII